MRNMEKLITELRPQRISLQRYLSIDIYKGIMIAFAIFINATSYFQYTPVWNKGSNLYGLTYVDLFGPFFLFALTITFKTSFDRRLHSSGGFKTYRHFIRRFLLYILIGFFITLNIKSTSITLQWGTLQMLGMTGLFLLLTIKIKLSLRIILAIFLAFFHQFVILQINELEIATIPHGGVLGLLAWFSFATFASIVNEYFINNKKKTNFALIGILFLFLGIVSNSFLTVSRQLVNLSFILISLGFSILILLSLFYLFEDLSRKWVWLKKERVLSVMGKNSLLLYILQSFSKFIPYFILPLGTIPLIFFSFGLLMVFLNYLLAYFLDRYQIYLVF